MVGLLKLIPMAILTVYRVTDTGAVLIPEAVKLTRHICRLNEKELAFLIDWTDYHGSFWQLPNPEERKKRAWKKWMGNDYPEITKKMELAYEEYNSLQYDPDYETALTYKQKIEMMKVDLLKEDSVMKIGAIDGAIEKLQKRVDEYEKRIRQTEDELILEGDRTMSFIEKWGRNSKQVELERRKRKENEILSGKADGEKTIGKEYEDDF